MLKLKNVSKFYYNNGVIASGFTKVSAQFEIGEFIVITGESGSGKSTLLNVISGLDSYEEGEMYINDLETSHYGEGDFEIYRKKYVSNIFQNFNLVNSYTVYQNVELVLLMNGYRKSDIKKKILNLIDRVGLIKYKNTKVSKLSGGQKQRVAIARALAKETPIIVCDEPTANLDSKSSKEIINILKEISKDKLLIMVTHDFPSVEKIATRVIKMHDGRIVSDKKNDEMKKDDKIELIVNDNDNIGLFNIIRLGIRNTFNIPAKFILIFIVFLFITVSLLTEYGALRKSEYESSKLGYNYYFSDTSDTRIIIKKLDGSSITNDDFKKIGNLDNVSYVIENDILLDEYLWFEALDNEGFYFDGLLRNISDFSGELDYGRLPNNDNEVVLLVNDYEYYFNERLDEAVEKNYYLHGYKNIPVKVVGVKYLNNGLFTDTPNTVYGSFKLLDEYMSIINRNYSETKIKIYNNYYDSYNALGYEFNLVISEKISSGNAIVSENINYACQDYNCKNKNMIIDVNNLHYEDNLSLKIVNTYNDNNIKRLIGIDKDNENNGSIFISKNDYDKLFNMDSYQASVFATRVDYVDSINDKLEDMGYYTLVMKRAMNNDGEDVAKVIKIVKLVVTVILVVTLFFISYFVIKLVLKSRNVYFSTLRILGASVGNTKRILDVELFVNASLAYVTYILFVILVYNNIIDIKFIRDCIEYLGILDYVLMYLILILMSYLISTRFSSKLFKNSAMKVYREEV